MAESYQVLHIAPRVSIASGLNRHITRQQFEMVGETRVITKWVPANADPKRTKRNKELISRKVKDENGNTRELTLQEAVDRRIKQANIKPRQGQARCLEMIFSGSHDTMVAMDRKTLLNWAKKTVKWAQDTWGEENVVSAVLHVDEKTPHIHMIVVPIVKGQSRRTRHHQGTGKSKKAYKIDHDKLRLCMNEVYTRGKLYGYHDSYAEVVGNVFGMERGIKAAPGSKVRHKNSEDYNRSLQKQAIEKQALIDELTADYDTKKTEIQEDIQQLQEKRTSLSTELDEEQDKLTKAKSKSKKAEKESKDAEKKLTELYEKKTAIEKEITQLQTRKETLSTAVEDEQRKFDVAKTEADKAEKETKGSKEKLTEFEKKIKDNTDVIQDQVADIEANNKTISEQNEEISSNQRYLHELQSIQNEISRKKDELNSLSSLGLLKMILEIPKRILADIQEMLKGFWKGNVTSYEEVQYTVEDESEKENFAKINIKNGDKDYFIEVREKTGHVYYNGDTEPYKWIKSHEEMLMPKLAEYFRSELTPEAKQFVESHYKKPTSTENKVWQSKQILGKAKIIQNAERNYTLMKFDRDFKKWMEVADCVEYAVKSDRTFDYISLTQKDGNINYYNQFGTKLTNKQLQKLGLGSGKGHGGPHR